MIGARWDEIDRGAKLWTIPGQRMKGAREHRVPLSDAALAIVDRLSDDRKGEFIFAGGRADRPASDMAMLVLLRRMGRWRRDGARLPFELPRLGRRAR